MEPTKKHVEITIEAPANTDAPKASFAMVGISLAAIAGQIFFLVKAIAG